MTGKTLRFSYKKFLGSFFYLGKLRGGGTYTSVVVSLLLYYFLDWSSIYYAGILLFSLSVGCYLSYGIEGDPDWFTLDEMAGVLITFFFHQRNLSALIIGLLVFRIIDIFKLPLFKKLEDLKFGIMLDDIAAGIIASLFLFILSRIYTL